MTIGADNTQFEKTMDETSRKLQETSQNVKSFSQGVTSAIDLIGNSGAKVNVAMGRTARAAGAEVQRIGNDVKSTLDTATDSIEQTGDRVKKVGNELDGTFKQLGTAVAGYFAFSTITSFAREVVNVRKEFESLEKSFSTLLGSETAGKGMFNEITEFATKTPMLEKDLASAAQTMLSFNIESEKVMPILKQLGDISMGDSQKLQSLALAFSQASSTGKLMGQDLLQMINAGFNPLAEISRTTGRSMKELKDDMAEGKITIDMIEGAFASATSEGGKFNGMLAGMSQTMEGAISNFEGAMQKFSNTLGEAIEQPIVDGVNAATEALNTLSESVDKVAATIAGLTAGLGTYKVACIVAAESAKGYTLAMQIQYRWMQLQTIAQKALNAAVQANPYVLAATALVTLVTTMATWYALSEKQTGAQKRLNEATTEFNKNVDIETMKVKAAFDELREAKEGTEEYEQAKQAILNQYGQYLDGLSAEIASLKDVEGAYNAVTEAVEKAARARAMQSAKESAYEAYGENLKKTSEPLYDILVDKKGEAEAQRIMKKLRREIEETGKISRRTQMEVRDIWGNNKKASDASMYMKGMELTAKALKDEMKKAKALFGGDEEEQKKPEDNKPKSTLAQDFQKTKEDYLKSEKELEKMRKNREDYTTQQYEDALKKRDDLKKKYEKLGGTSVTKTNKDANKEIKNRADKEQRVADAQEKADKAAQRAREDAELATEQYEIDKLADGTEKRVRQINLDKEKEVKAIERAKEDTVAAHEQAAREIWEAQNPDASEKGKTWENTGKTGLSFELTDEEKKMYKAREEAALAAHAQRLAEEKQKDEQAMRDYLMEYGTYEQKKQAIAEDYDARIAKQRKSGESEYAIKITEKQKQKALKDLDFEQVKKDINWEYVFGDLDNVNTETLAVVKQQLEDFMAAAKELTPDQIQTVTDAITRLQDKMDLATPIATIKNARAEFIAAKKEYDAYAKAYDKAKDAGDKASMEKASKGMVSADQKMTKAKNREAKAFSETTETVNNYAEALKQAGEAIGGATGQCLSLAAGAIQAGVGMANGIKAFGNAVSAVEKSVAILAIIEAALQAIQMIAELFGDSADQTLTNYVETMDTYLNLLKEDINDVTDAMKSNQNTIKDTVGYYEQLMDLQKKSAMAVKSQSQTWLNSGASKGFLGIGSSSSEGVKVRKQIETQLGSSNKDVKEFTEKGVKQLEEYYRKAMGRSGSIGDFGRMDFIWKLSDDDLRALAKDTEAMALLGDELGGAVKSYVDAIGDATDAQNAKLESILGVSFEDFYDDFIDLISDMDNESADFAKNFGEYLKKALIKNLVADKYKGKLEELWKSAATDMENGNLEDKIGYYRQKYQEYADEAQREVEMIEKITGVTEQSNQEALAKGIESITADQADQLIGRMTAIQIAVEADKNTMEGTLTQLIMISSLTTQGNAYLSDILSQHAIGNSYLEDIAKYSKAMSLELDGKMQKIVDGLNRL